MSISINFNCENTYTKREGDGYEKLLGGIRESFDRATGPLFTTGIENLYDIFLEKLPWYARQHYNCRTCRNFVNRYGGLVTINNNGTLEPAMWDFDIPAFFEDAVYAIRENVRKSNVTGVFLTSETRLGTASSGGWTHMCVDIPIYRRHHRNFFETADRSMAKKREEFKMVHSAWCRYDPDVVKKAINMLKSDQLYRSEKFIKNAEWFLDLITKNMGAGMERPRNYIWKAVATAPEGFCHIGSSVLGTLLDDIHEGRTDAEIIRRFNEKVDPLYYQRPQAAPSRGNVERAEKIFKELGLENSLKRRFARLDEVKKIWMPRMMEYKAAEFSEGIFSGIKTKEDLEPKKMPNVAYGVTTMTWVKFREKVLPEAKHIEMYVGPGRQPFGALVTAVYPDANPIIRWDLVGVRNPVNWYCYNGGSYPSQWNLTSGWVTVTGIALQPNLWQPGYENIGKGVMFILKNCRDAANKSSALFPEVLRSELYEVRATIEAYSKANKIYGLNEASACGMLLQECNDDWNYRVRVTTDVGIREYKLDRWD